jgi:hypothetical protein
MSPFSSFCVCKLEQIDAYMNTIARIMPIVKSDLFAYYQLLENLKLTFDSTSYTKFLVL